jgi:hypothetical protein
MAQPITFAVNGSRSRSVNFVPVTQRGRHFNLVDGPSAALCSLWFSCLYFRVLGRKVA